MRQPLAVVTTLLGGCSFIYNPNNINPDVDAKVVDVEVVVDVDPSMLNLDYAFPGTIYEGVGAGNSRPAVLVVRGEQIAPNATVTVVPMTGDPSQITVNGVTIAADHNWIAISITAPVDMTQDETGTHAVAPVPLVITVDNGNNIVRSLPTTTVALKFLDQLTTPIVAPVDPMKRYSMIDVAAAEALPAGAGAGRISLRSMSSITFHSGITLDGSNAMPGPGGCAGSTGAGAAGASSSAGDNAPCNSGPSAAPGVAGAPGGYGGDPQISTYANATPGGGGGGGSALVGGLGGGPGGGGAGMLSLEAGGDLAIMKNTTSNVSISAIGGAGQPGALGAGAGGGGGTGGTLLLRSGGTLSLTGGVVLDGGAKGNGSPVGNVGIPGHLRFDAAQGSAPSGYHGPMFDAVPYFSLDQTVVSAISLTGQTSDTMNTGQVYDKDLNAPDDGRFVINVNAVGVATPTIKLSPGYNLVCASVPNGNAIQREESGNCAETVYLPGTH